MKKSTPRSHLNCCVPLHKLYTKSINNKSHAIQILQLFCRWNALYISGISTQSYKIWQFWNACTVDTLSGNLPRLLSTEPSLHRKDFEPFSNELQCTLVWVTVMQFFPLFLLKKKGSICKAFDVARPLLSLTTLFVVVWHFCMVVALRHSVRVCFRRGSSKTRQLRLWHL